MAFLFYFRLTAWPSFLRRCFQPPEIGFPVNVAICCHGEYISLHVQGFSSKKGMGSTPDPGFGRCGLRLPRSNVAPGLLRKGSHDVHNSPTYRVSRITPDVLWMWLCRVLVVLWLHHVYIVVPMSKEVESFANIFGDL